MPIFDSRHLFQQVPSNSGLTETDALFFSPLVNCDSRCTFSYIMATSIRSSEGINTEASHVAQDPAPESEHESKEATSTAHITATSSSPSTLVPRKKAATFTGPSIPHPERTNGRRRRTASGAGRQKGLPSLRTLQRAASTMLIPDRRIGDAPGVWRSLRAIILASRGLLLFMILTSIYLTHFSVNCSP